MKIAPAFWKRTGLAALILAAALPAQEPAASPRFDVVSIHAVPLNAPPTQRDQDFTPILPGGQFIDSRTSLIWMIVFAYDVKFPDIQLLGLPKWAKDQSYSVAAKPAEGFPALSRAANQDQVRQMMRAMLADRFHLQLHAETRQGPTFNLELARGGVQIKEVDAPVPPAHEGYVNAAFGDDSGRMIGNKSTMAGIATALTVMLKTPVIDRTGLRGYYDFDVKWRAAEADKQAASPGFGAEGISLLISNLQKQFGLRLQKSTGPVEHWVVDHVEPPTSN